MSDRERAGRWVRVSTGGQDEALQEPQIDKWIADHGYQLGPCGPKGDGTYRVHGKSAYLGQHAKMLDQAIKDMQDGKLTVLVAWQSGRIERRGTESVFELVARVRRAGGRIEFSAPGDQHLNEANDMSDVMLALAAWKDHKESKDKSERVMLAKTDIRKNRALDGRAPYGYRVAGDKYNRKLVTYEPEAKVIHEAVDRYLGRNGYAAQSLDDIADSLNARGIPSPMWRGKPGKCWYGRTLGQLFKNPTIAGRRMDNWTPRHDRKNRTTVHDCPAIISWEDHLALVARLDSRASRKGISPKNVFLLTGLLSDEAGHPMFGSTERGYRYYRCVTRGCGSRVRQADADEEVSRQVIDTWGNGPHLVRKLIPGEDYTDQIARKRQDIRELDPESDDYDERLTELRTELAEFRHMQETKARRDEVKWVPARNPDGTDETTAQHWDKMDTAGRRDWLKERGARVTARMAAPSETASPGATTEGRGVKVAGRWVYDVRWFVGMEDSITNWQGQASEMYAVPLES